jgi:hypothetical protein
MALIGAIPVPGPININGLEMISSRVEDDTVILDRDDE